MITLQQAKRLALCLIFCLMSASAAWAQTTAFTYQGKLSESGNPADSFYDFEFRLFDVVTGGTPVGTLQRLNVSVTNGIFTVSLDFGAEGFRNSPRFLEIAVKPAGSPDPFTTLAPRQPVTSAPFAIHSLSADTSDIATFATTATNANQLGGVAASQYVVTTDPRMSDARPPTAGSTSYIQNSAAQQAASNFFISGDGAAGGTLSGNIVNAATQYNVGGDHVLSAAGGNIFAGKNAGQGNTTGNFNSFFGAAAGENNTTGNSNSFFGNNAGAVNDSGSFNSFFGNQAGLSNTGGGNNAFFGVTAGNANTTGADNAFFGRSAGFSNTIGDFNSFFGRSTGFANTTGGGNSFFGATAGLSNTIGESNSFFGNQAGNLNTTGDSNSFVGRSAGSNNTTGFNNSFFGATAGFSNTTGSNNTVVGNGANVGANNLTFATALGAGAVVSTSNTVVIGRGGDEVRVPGNLVVVTLGAAGGTDLCRNASNQIATCSSSLRYKTAVQPFIGGLDILRRLRPITFAWRDGGTRDIGLGAEDVERVEPLLVTYNQKGQIEGVKYGQITTVLVNAVHEQEAQIAKQQELLQQQQQQNQAQQKHLRHQQQQLDALKKLVCLSHPRAEVCN